MLQMDLPSSSTDELSPTQNQDDLLVLDDDTESEFISPDQLADNLITLSLLSNARSVLEN